MGFDGPEKVFNVHRADVDLDTLPSESLKATISMICWKALRPTASYSAVKRFRSDTHLKNLASFVITKNKTVALRKWIRHSLESDGIYHKYDLIWDPTSGSVGECFIRGPCCTQSARRWGASAHQPKILDRAQSNQSKALHGKMPHSFARTSSMPASTSREQAKMALYRNSCTHRRRWAVPSGERMGEMCFLNMVSWHSYFMSPDLGIFLVRPASRFDFPNNQLLNNSRLSLDCFSGFSTGFRSAFV